MCEGLPDIGASIQVDLLPLIAPLMTEVQCLSQLHEKRCQGKFHSRMLSQSIGSLISMASLNLSTAPQCNQSAVLCILGAGQQQANNSAESMASPRALGRSSSAGMGSGESSGRGPTWSQVPRSHGQRVTARIPSWLHLPSLGQP